MSLKTFHNDSPDKKTIRDMIDDTIDVIKNTKLPPALVQLRNKRIIFSVIVIMTSIAISIIIKNLNALFGIVIALYFIYHAIKTTYDYAKGKISEEHMFCVNVGNGLKDRISSGVTVVLMDKDGKTHTLFYPVSSKKPVFLKNAEYIIYIHENNPTTIIAFDTL
ncbi:MAG: hypothetical protein IJT36_04150 [Alphaproteobacteria bacterium]|nr:hypothetical protein [Alphaproteobacteria bacterium]